MKIDDLQRGDEVLVTVVVRRVAESGRVVAERRGLNLVLLAEVALLASVAAEEVVVAAAVAAAAVRLASENLDGVGGQKAVVTAGKEDEMEVEAGVDGWRVRDQVLRQEVVVVEEEKQVEEEAVVVADRKVLSSTCQLVNVGTGVRRSQISQLKAVLGAELSPLFQHLRPMALHRPLVDQIRSVPFVPS